MTSTTMSSNATFHFFFETRQENYSKNSARGEELNISQFIRHLLSIPPAAYDNAMEIHLLFKEQQEHIEI
jgi:hypothetical protein